jgi:hypothetical protein
MVFCCSQKLNMDTRPLSLCLTTCGAHTRGQNIRKAKGTGKNWFFSALLCLIQSVKTWPLLMGFFLFAYRTTHNELEKNRWVESFPIYSDPSCARLITYVLECHTYFLGLITPALKCCSAWTFMLTVFLCCLQLSKHRLRKHTTGNALQPDQVSKWPGALRILFPLLEFLWKCYKL